VLKLVHAKSVHACYQMPVHVEFVCTLSMKFSCFARGVMELLLFSKASEPVVKRYGTSW